MRTRISAVKSTPALSGVPVARSLRVRETEAREIGDLFGLSHG
jgi:hypothetical protein